MRIHCDWGPEGADAAGRRATTDARRPTGAAGRRASVVVVVDVLSFTTTLTVAADRGIAVRPYPWRGAGAAEFAREQRAILAVGRREAAPGEVSLSPRTVRDSVGVERLVLPSPNGSAISARLAGSGATVVGVSLRNAPAAAAWVRRRLPADGTVTVIAAGEHRPGGGWRPAVEDLWGAGSFLAHLVRRGADEPSPEAGAALAAYRSVADGLAAALDACVSGRELHDLGFGGDVAIAAEAGVSTAVPVLRDGWYVADQDAKARFQ